MVGYHALSLSTLSYRIGARGRLPGLVAGAVCAVMLFAGSALLAFFPKPILGGLLFFLGLDFLVEWVDRRLAQAVTGRIRRRPADPGRHRRDQLFDRGGGGAGGDDRPVRAEL